MHWINLLIHYSYTSSIIIIIVVKGEARHQIVVGVKVSEVLISLQTLKDRIGCIGSEYKIKSNFIGVIRQDYDLTIGLKKLFL